MAARKDPGPGPKPGTKQAKRFPLVESEQGRPIYDAERHCVFGRRLALMGFADAEIAEHLGIAERTYYLWRDQHPEFDDAVRGGKLVADGEVVEGLFNRARERLVKRRQPMVVANGAGAGSRVEIVEYDDIEPADVRAATHWLANRQPQLWSLNGPRAQAQADTSGTERGIQALKELLGPDADVEDSRPMTAKEEAALTKLLGPPDP